MLVTKTPIFTNEIKIKGREPFVNVYGGLLTIQLNFGRSAHKLVDMQRCDFGPFSDGETLEISIVRKTDTKLGKFVKKVKALCS